VYFSEPSSANPNTDVYLFDFMWHAGMDTLNAAIAATGRDSEDALKVLGRVADAFDNPGSLHKMDKEVLFVVNVVKSRHLLPSLSSEESVCQDVTCGSYDSSLDTSYDEDVEVVELGDASSYPYASRRHPSPRSFSERVCRQDDGTYDVTKMLLTSSPLDRLDRLARMELKRTGWFERTDKWSVVELGLSLPTTPPKRATSPNGEKRGHTPKSPVYSEEGSSYLSTLCYGDGQRQRRGRLGQVVRNIVKRMKGSEERWSGFWH